MTQGTNPGPGMKHHRIKILSYFNQAKKIYRGEAKNESIPYCSRERTLHDINEQKSGAGTRLVTGDR